MCIRDSIGASVVEKGTANGTITDLDGNFSLNVKAGATLVVSYVGYKSEEVKAGRGPLNITLKEDAKALDEVVVTALGIKRERKALGYGIDEVKGEALTKAKETNLINSMAGRVPGLVVSQTAGGPSGSTRVILRGRTETVSYTHLLEPIDRNRVAVATVNCFFLVDKHTGNIQHYANSQEFHNQNVSAYIISMLFNDDGTVWLGTEGGGLNLYDMKNRTVKTFTVQEGLPSNDIYSCLLYTSRCV